ncbi:probable RNA-dependent RNA polymerase 1 isoform X2 [Centruroides sculpturatus]|uniref:probable RNA-dependent RNA polymerase 1 isoform X2 n=1 Tax=Centruroides sculpturatus TaxID=218467 RepID=UPI000C6EB122|nr:probable RNA-dependent RNA polymerase 1 isoform X2 [Centruroides sculpturatus]
MNRKKEIEVKIIWLPKQKIDYIKKKVEDCIGCKLSEWEEIPRLPDYYEEEQNVLNCKLNLPKSLEDYKQILIERWCRQDFGQNQAWISIKENKIFDSFTKLNDKEVNIHSFAFGTIVGLNNLVEHYDTAKQNLDNSLEYKITQIKGDFEHDCKKLLIYFIVTKKNLNKKEKSAETHLLHKFEIKYSDIYRILINKVPTNKTAEVCLYITYPAMVYMVKIPENAKTEEYTNYTNRKPCTHYTRMPSFYHCSKSDIGLSTVLKLQMTWEKSQDVIHRLVDNCRNMDYFFSFLNKSKRPKNYPIPQIPSDNFNCIYLLKCIISRTRDVSVQIYLQNNLRDINEKLKRCVSENPKALELTLIEINAALERKHIVMFENALNVIYNRNKDFNDDDVNGKNGNCVNVRRAILTPTRVIFLPPQTYFKCRFFRKFDEENALRVSVRDDNFEKLSFSFRGDQSEFNKAIDIIKRELLNGFKIGKRHYKILGCSTSHLRDQGLMFYAYEDIGNILCELGKFEHIKCVSKYMARMGQVFSQAIEAAHVDKNNIEEEDDIKVTCPKSQEEYEFSDGIGKISLSLARKVYENLKFTNQPSAMQIRYAGFKGMLTVWPDLEGDKIIFRKSMNKFPSDSESLEVLKVSKPRLVYLNRHFITILSHLGIRDSVFFELQKRMLEKLLKSFIYEEDARDLLKECCSFRINYDAIHKYGIEMLFEPFFVSLLKAIFYKHIETLKEKTRIKITPDKGRTMFGVLDETKQLEYGQVFVQYSKDVWDEEDRSPIILTGEVLVTKNPCMHPGDVRKFQAVDIPELRHIKDCIVFPAKGKRPHPNEMAGSDLDGDEYSVIWLEDLIFECNNHPPMDFPKATAEELDHPVQAEDMVKFFCKFIKEYNLGKLANAHLAWADKEYDGVMSKKCINIAKKYSKCLDFAKTGVNETLSHDEYVSEYPDFFDKKIEKDSYRSTKILGQLYRCSKIVQLGFQEFVESEYDTPNYKHYRLDDDLLYDSREIYIRSAKKAYRKYKRKVETMLTQYGIDTEAELLSGYICNMHKYVTENQELNDLQLIEVRVKMLVKEMRKDFVSEFVNDEEYDEKTILENLYGSEHKEKVFQKASAWYQVTYDETQREETNIKKRRYYLGLPWTITDVLNTMKRNRNVNKSCISRRKQFENQIEKSLKNNFPNAFEKPIERNVR